MPWTVKPKFSAKTKPSQTGIPRKGTVYPWLPAIIDEETLTEITTLESGEHEFVSQQGRERRRYLSGLYLKAVSVLGHSHFQPKDLPLQFRCKLASQLGCDQQLARVLTIDGGEKSRIVSSVRTFLGLSSVGPEVLEKLGSWLESSIARKETEIPMIINAAVHYLRGEKIELPSRKVLNSIAEKALRQATQNFIHLLNGCLSPEEQKRLDSLMSGTALERFKMPVPQASPNNMAKELFRIAEIRHFIPQDILLESTSRLYLESFAELTRRYTTPEIAQIQKARRRALLLCYMIERHAQLLDTAADMAIRVWENANHHADDYANARTKEMAEDYEAREKVLKSILKVIKISQNPD